MIVNQAPVLILWAEVGLNSWDSSMTKRRLSRAVAGLNAYLKVVSLGAFPADLHLGKKTGEKGLLPVREVQARNSSRQKRGWGVSGNLALDLIREIASA